MNKKSYVFGSNSLAIAKKIKQANEQYGNAAATKTNGSDSQLRAVRKVYASIQRARYVDEHVATTPVSV